MSKVEDIHFENWYNEIEGFSLRSERIYNDIASKQNDINYQWSIIHYWIKNAYCIGFREGIDYQNKKHSTAFWR
jgi:hypothetical protein